MATSMFQSFVDEYPAELLGETIRRGIFIEAFASPSPVPANLCHRSLDQQETIAALGYLTPSDQTTHVTILTDTYLIVSTIDENGKREPTEIFLRIP